MGKSSFFTRLLSVLLTLCLLLAELGPSMAWAAAVDDDEISQETADLAEDDNSDADAVDETEDAAQEGEDISSETGTSQETEGESSDTDDSRETEGESSDTDDFWETEDESSDTDGSRETEDADSTETAESEDESVTNEDASDESTAESADEDADSGDEDVSTDIDTDTESDVAADAEEPETVSEEDDALTEEEQAEQDAMAEIESILAAAMASDETDYDYATELAKFPSSYQTYLKALHETYPNWIFVAVDTGLSWDDVISGEYGSNSTIDYNLNGETDDLLLNNHSGYYSSSSYSSTNHYKPIDGTHVSASRAAIAYYMDPRNFLTAKYIFQFEDQTYSSVQQLSGVKKVLKNAADSSSSSSKGLYYITTYVNTSGETVNLSSLNSSYGSNYSSIIYNVGVATDVSPYYLASKIVQETGAVTTNQSISGTVDGYVGYYNFYNIGATASTTGTAVLNGLAYAKNHGWYNPVLALYGGAEFLANSYISKGQNTSYYMRFNVSPDRYYSAYSHQYMSATYAVAAESITTYNAYNASGAVSSAFLFYIPVFDDMPDEDSLVRLSGTNTGTTTAATKLYSSPSMSSSVISVPKGSTVTVLGGYQTQSTGYTERLYYPYWYRVKVTVSGTTYTGYIRESQVSLSSAYTIKTGSTKSIASTLTTTGDAGTIYYETSDPTVATVSDSGVITTVAAGTCTIYAISGAGSFDAVGVTVSNTVSSSTTTLSKPSLTSATNSASGITVKWSAVTNATSYRVYRKTSSGSSWTRIASVSTNSYTDTTAASGTTYIYTVRAVNSSTTSGYDSTGITCLRLSRPSLNSATASSSGITVKWSAVTGAKGYRVYRKTSGESWTRIATISSGSTVSYTDFSSLTSGTTYYYTVRAFSGSYSSAYNTSGISAKAVSATTTLSKPSLTSAINSASGITVKWSAVTNATSYRVYRKTSSGSSWTRIASVSTNSYTDTTAASGTTYIYTVRAVNSSTTSGYDSTGITCLRLSRPSLNSATASSSGITVKWSAVTGAKGYRVYRKTSGGSWTRIATISSGSIVSYTDSSSLTSGTTYYYTVRAFSGSYSSAYNTSGISAKATSSSVSYDSYVTIGMLNYRTGPGSSYSLGGTLSAGTTVKVVSGETYDVSGVTWYRAYIGGSYYYISSRYLLATPTPSSATNATSGITVKWAKVTNATGYRVYRKVSGGSWSRIANISSGSTVSYTDTTAAAGTTYVYTVRAIYTTSSGTILSGYSSSGVTCIRLTRPNLTSATASSSGITVKWGAVTGAKGYRVYRKISGGSWTRIATISSSATLSYTDNSGLISGTTYYYTVRAVSGSYLSSYNTSGVSAKATVSSAPTLVNYVTTGMLNYRTGPGTSYTLAGTFASGTTVQVVDGETYDVNGTIWYRVYVNGSYYYCSSKYLTKA